MRYFLDCSDECRVSPVNLIVSCLIIVCNLEILLDQICHVSSVGIACQDKTQFICLLSFGLRIGQHGLPFITIQLKTITVPCVGLRKPVCLVNFDHYGPVSEWPTHYFPYTCN